MNKWYEQLCEGARSNSGLYRKHLKRCTKRLMRRLGKKDPENAPKKTRYNGYED